MSGRDQVPIEQRPRRRLAGPFAVGVACVLVCAAPVVAGLASGAAARVFDAPVWLAVVVAGVVASVLAVRRRRGGGADGCC